MITPSPLLSTGALEGASTPKSRIRITVLTILVLHVVFIGGLLLQGCNNNTGSGAGGDAASNRVSTLPPLHDTNYFSSFPGDTFGDDRSTSRPPETQTHTPPPYTPPSYPPTTTPPATAELPSQPSRLPDYTARAPSVGTIPSPMAPATEHVIRRGDTIGALARKYGVTEKAIVEANPSVRPRALQIDDTLTIPAPVPAPPRAASEPRLPVPVGGDEYVVKSGDTLSRIAGQFGVTVDALRSANGIRGDRIMPNQRLIIPPKPAPSNGRSSGGASRF